MLAQSLQISIVRRNKTRHRRASGSLLLQPCTRFSHAPPEPHRSTSDLNQRYYGEAPGGLRWDYGDKMPFMTQNMGYLAKT